MNRRRQEQSLLFYSSCLNLNPIVYTYVFLVNSGHPNKTTERKPTTTSSITGMPSKDDIFYCHFILLPTYIGYLLLGVHTILPFLAELSIGNRFPT